MKIQDILFIILLLFLFWKHSPRLIISAGLVSLIISIPLFAKHIFFTAEHLTWYAAGFLLLAIVLQMVSLRKYKE